ncbi:hypothetical protein [Salibacterium halotolerans]|uniref:hypothetical protein n=1 Tax=Salibacterium halotolerans TaxID=1884432 RepID=UPI001113D4EA|nr:hypothetical protein [Salibacterium halotolerans]
MAYWLLPPSQKFQPRPFKLKTIIVVDIGAGTGNCSFELAKSGLNVLAVSIIGRESLIRVGANDAPLGHFVEQGFCREHAR